MTALSAPAWKKGIDGLAKKAQFSAELLAGQMPQSIDEVFVEAGVSLFPKPPSPKYAAVRAAEDCYRRVGGAVLRSPGIYGPGRGIHRRLSRGDFRLSGDGTRYGSRIHGV